VFYPSGDAWNLWWVQSTDGKNWTEPQQVTNTGISHSPSAVVFREKLYVFHQGITECLWFNSSVDGVNWLADTKVLDTKGGNVGMTFSPSAVVWNDTLYVFHQAAGASNALWYTWTQDGVNWATDTYIENTELTESPSACHDGYSVCVFHQGGNHSGDLWCKQSTMDFSGKQEEGLSWKDDFQVPNRGISYSPGCTTVAQSPYVFYQGKNDSHEGHYIVGGEGPPEGQGIECPIPNAFIIDSPSAVLYNNNLYVFHQALGQSVDPLSGKVIPGEGGALSYNKCDPDVAVWAGDAQIPKVFMRGCPSAVVTPTA